MCLCLLKVNHSMWKFHPPCPTLRFCFSLPVTNWPSSAQSWQKTCQPLPLRWAGWWMAVISSRWSAAAWLSPTHHQVEHKGSGGRRVWREWELENTNSWSGGWTRRMEEHMPAASVPSLRKEEGVLEEGGGGTWLLRKYPTLWQWKCPRSVSEHTVYYVCFGLCFIAEFKYLTCGISLLRCRKWKLSFMPDKFHSKVDTAGLKCHSRKGHCCRLQGMMQCSCALGKRVKMRHWTCLCQSCKVSVFLSVFSLFS